jgi:hypothetical protein
MGFIWGWVVGTGPVVRFFVHCFVRHQHTNQFANRDTMLIRYLTGKRKPLKAMGEETLRLPLWVGA